MNIKLNKVEKIYNRSLFDTTIGIVTDIIGRKRVSLDGNRIVRAINNISLEIQSGERVAIIGQNGAGKTTLLQLIAGLSTPSSGEIRVEGEVSCIMSLGIGIREELSGRDNIFVNGEIHGKTRVEILSTVEEVISFADIGEFIDHPVRTYSTGMKARLAFAMNIDIEPDILILDEVLSVGDARFNLKAFSKMKEMCDRGNIVIVVTHSMPAVLSLCNRCIWLENGEIIMDGDPVEVTTCYVESVRAIEEKALESIFRMHAVSQSIYPEIVLRMSVLDTNGNNQNVFFLGEHCFISYKTENSLIIRDIEVVLDIERMDGIHVLQKSVLKIKSSPSSSVNDQIKGSVQIKDIYLGKGLYEVSVSLFGSVNGKYVEKLCTSKQLFKIENRDYPHLNPIYYYPVAWNIFEKE